MRKRGSDLPGLTDLSRRALLALLVAGVPLAAIAASRAQFSASALLGNHLWLARPWAPWSAAACWLAQFWSSGHAQVAIWGVKALVGLCPKKDLKPRHSSSLSTSSHETIRHHT